MQATGFLPRNFPGPERHLLPPSYLRECDDASLLAKVQLAGVEEVEDAVEVAGLSQEFVLVELGVEAVAEVEDLGVGLTLAQFAQARLGKTLQ